MAEKYLRTIETRKGVRLLALHYLIQYNHLGKYVQLQQIARHIGCHPKAVSDALDPLLKDPLWSPHLEKQKVGTAVIYKATNGEPTILLKRFFDIIEEKYGRA